MELGLEGKRALITGSSRGIGFAIADGLAREGVHVHLVARTQKTLEEAKAEIERHSSVEVYVHPIDLTQTESANEVYQACGEIDILINNAGSIPPGGLDSVDEATWRKGWDLKVFGHLNVTRLYYEQMKTRGSGVIINIAGAAGERPSHGFLAGAMANAAIIAFAKGLGGGSIDYGIRVLTVNPGGTETERLRTLAEHSAEQRFGDASRWRELHKDLPLGRVAKPEEVADLVVFLASDRAAYINATTVTIDGGQSQRH